MHPDLFGGETPIREPAGKTNLKVYRVELVFYEPQNEQFYVVAANEDEAEQKAWDMSDYYMECISDHCEDITELEPDDLLDDPWVRGKNDCATAGDLLNKVLSEDS